MASDADAAAALPLDGLTVPPRPAHPGSPGVAATSFATAVDLALHLAAAPQGGYIPIESAISGMLKTSGVMKSWMRTRDPLGVLPHFRRYRKERGFLRYEAAVEAIANGTASASEVTLRDGLHREAANSRLILPPGQILFHGRADRRIDGPRPHAAVVSASLSAAVARWHAEAFAHKFHTKGVIYVLRLQRAVQTLFGHSSSSPEFEILLASDLTYSVSSVHPGTIDVVEAEVG